MQEIKEEFKELDLVNMGREIMVPIEIGDYLQGVLSKALNELNTKNPLNLLLPPQKGISEEYIVIAQLSDSNPYKILLTTKTMRTTPKECNGV